jgi:hypothetical protein
MRRRLALALGVLSAVVVVAGCRGGGATYDVAALEVTRYRYLVDPRDPLVHTMAEVRNDGNKVVREAMVVVSGIGRNGERRGEGRTKVKEIKPGETRQVSAWFRNRARLAAVEVRLEPVPEGQRGR